MTQVWMRGEITALALGGRSFAPAAYARDDADKVAATLFGLDDTTAASSAVAMRWAGVNRGTPAGLIVPIVPIAPPKTTAPKAPAVPRRDDKDE